MHSFDRAPRLIEYPGNCSLKKEHSETEMTRAYLVVWLSDGGRGFWRVYRTCFATAIAVLDFFHAAGHLARATEALFGSLHSALDTP